jgi:hypothetical protein
LLVNFLQVGIDHFGLTQNGMHWPPDGGHASGRKLPILFAGIVLNDSEMKNISFMPDNTGVYRCGDKICFGEDAQTFHVDPENIGQYFILPFTTTSVIYGGILDSPELGNYSFKHSGMPEWGIRHEENYTSGTASYLSVDRLYWDAGYRRCCNANNWAGYLLAVHVMGIRDLWNHNALFDYQDRYMEVTKAGGAWPGWRASGFSAAMWDAYREDYGCMWKMDNSSDAYSNGHYVCGSEKVMCEWQNSTCTNCAAVTECVQYPNQRATDYDPCGLSCS